MSTLFKSLATVIAVTFALCGSAQAEISDTLQVAEGSRSVPVKFATDVYIVQMKQSPVLAYEGGIDNLKATKPLKGKKINSQNLDVINYVAHLDARHNDLLSAVGAKTKIYDYRYAINGFAAVLSSEQVKTLKAHPDVMQVWRDELRSLQTDSTPDYLNLSGAGGVWDMQGKGENVIVGVLDTGITPEHPSFSDQIDLSDSSGSSAKDNLAYGPAPAGWNGECQAGETFSQDDCNNKLIGARYFHAGFDAGKSGIRLSESLSARDTDGHGSHTAGTAAGNEGVANTINGNLISGIAPRARIAAYKVCWEPRVGNGGCASSDSAAAIDAAIADGVDVINFSIGGSSTSFAGPDDVGFLLAADAGVWVATSNGNSGPGAQTTGTPAGVPWITAVGATQDNEVFTLRLNATGDLTDSYFAVQGGGPVRFDSDVVENLIVASPLEACSELDNTNLTGKLALVRRGTCNFTDKYFNAAAAGATALIVYNDGASADRFDPFIMGAPGTTIPGAMIGFVDGDLIHSTLTAGGSVTGVIGPGTEVSGDNRIAGFSSRGPNGGALDVIKPDVSAPGVSIIAAGASADQHSAPNFIRISGTSMASPHVAGLFALLKEAHPDWSAAMAKSAVMTSARQNLKKTQGEDAADAFDIGAGHIVPASAFDPGLVYDVSFFEYLAFSCGNNVQLVSDGSCAFLTDTLGLPSDGSQLNLASIAIAEFIGSETINRTVTSVTAGTTTFTVAVEAPEGIDVVVSPTSLELAQGESAEYSVTFSANADVNAGEWTFGSVTWNNDAGASPARSPIAIRPQELAVASEVKGIGVDGALSFAVGFGYTGDYSAGTHGLAEASIEAGNVLDDPGNSFAFQGPGTTLHLAVLSADTQVARWSLFNEATDGNDDLDLYVYYCPGGACSLIGSSGNSDSNEEVTLSNPASGLYAIFVHGWQTDGADANYDLYSWAVGDDAANMTVTAPAAAVAGTTGSIDVSWMGLDSGKKYLGSVSHSDADGVISQTVVSISTE